MSVLTECLHTICVPNALRGQKRGLDPLVIKLRVDVIYHVGAGERSRVL